MKKNSAKSSKTPRLSDAEWTIMKPFWEKGELAARDLFAALPPSHTWSYKTVKTMLARLVKKGVLEYTQVGNSYLYKARFSRDEMVRKAVRSFSHRVLDGTLRPFLLNFFEGREPSPEELATLREMLKQLEQKQSDAQKEGEP